MSKDLNDMLKETPTLTFEPFKEEETTIATTEETAPVKAEEKPEATETKEANEAVKKTKSLEELFDEENK